MKQSKYKIKLICGYRQDQEYTIDANEAHKAYYLFEHPEKRGTFDNGLAIKGADIQRIVPDYNAIMGWNPDHKLSGDDYNQIHTSGVMEKMNQIMSLAKDIARNAPVKELAIPLIKLKNKYQSLAAGSMYAKQLTQQKNEKKLSTMQ